MMNEKLKKQLLRYVEDNLSKGYSVKSIKDVLDRSGLGGDFGDRIVRNYLIKTVFVKPLLVVVLISLVSFLFLLRLPPPIGLAPMPPEIITVMESYNFTDDVVLTFTERYEYIWDLVNKGNLTAVRLSGFVSERGSARAYLEHDDESYLIFDSSRLSRDSGGVVVYNKDEVDSENKSVRIDMQGGGRKGISDLFEFNINGEFNWSVEHNKVCTKWSVNLEDAACYGSSECCDFVGLDSLGNWDDSFYLNYGRYGRELENIVKAQIIYYDVNLEIPYSKIVYSNSAEVRAEFYEEISFEDVCIETCLLPRFNSSSYKLVFEIEDASLHVDSISYTVEREVNVSRNAPSLVKEFDDITLYKDYDIRINLSEYFYDLDDGELTYYAYKADNISIVIRENRAQILPDYNFTGKRYMYFTASDGIYDVSSNVFFVDVVEKPLKIEEVEVSEELVKPKVVINRPVRWVKKVNASDRVINLSVDISSDALNVSVRDVKDDKMISSDNLKINDKGVIKDATDYRDEKRIEQINRLEERLRAKIPVTAQEDPTDKESIREIVEEIDRLGDERNKLTGYAVGYQEEGLLTMLFGLVSGIEITTYTIYEECENETNATSVIIEDIIEEVEVVYWTEGPISEEEDITNGKRIVVSSDVHYEDILAYTYLDDVPQNRIRLYRIADGSRELVKDVSYLDENNNNLIDKIEWVIPSLSNATYEVILIVKAEHLNSSRDFIADVYEYVKEKDNNWTLINGGDYIRVKFEIPLDNTRDITIYARANESSSVEIYTEDNDTLITKFENVSEENWYKVYLTSLNDSYDVFDLKVNDSVEFDYIVDPKIGAAGGIDFVYPTPENGHSTTNTSVEINISINASLDSFVWNWNSANYTFYNDSLVLMMNFDNVSALGENYNLIEGYTVLDLSKYGNNGIAYANGTATNGPVWNYTGRYGGAFEFDGVDDYVQTTLLYSYANGITLSVWVNVLPSSSGGTIVSDGAGNTNLRGTSLSIYTNGNPYFTGTYAITGQHLWNLPYEADKRDGKWHLITGTWDGTTSANGVKLYVDGELQVQSTATSTIDSGSYEFNIGSSMNGDGTPSGFFNGTIDEVRIYNRSLSEDEIKQQYFSNLRKYDADKWEFYVNQTYDEPFDSAVYDYYGCAKDIIGNENCTETRVLNVYAEIPQIEFIEPPTPINGYTTTNTSVEIKINITKADDLDTFKWNWNGTNYTFYNDSLVLMMNFDNVSGLGDSLTKAVDVSGYGNDGVLYNDVAWVTKGRYGKALQFDGINDYVNVSSSLNLDVFSVEFWFRPEENYDSGTSYVSFVYDDNYEVYIWNGEMVFEYEGSRVSSTINSWGKDEWYYVLATYDGTTLTLYIKGEYENSAVVSAPFIVQNNNGENVALFSDFGDIVLKGNCGSGVDCIYPGDDAFIIQNPLGETVAYINSTGDLCIEDSNCNDNDVSCDSPGEGSFIVKNTADEIVSYINATGDLCLIGELIENGEP